MFTWSRSSDERVPETAFLTFEEFAAAVPNFCSLALLCGRCKRRHCFLRVGSSRVKQRSFRQVSKVLVALTRRAQLRKRTSSRSAPWALDSRDRIRVLARACVGRVHVWAPSASSFEDRTGPGRAGQHASMRTGRGSCGLHAWAAGRCSAQSGFKVVETKCKQKKKKTGIAS